MWILGFLKDTNLSHSKSSHMFCKKTAAAKTVVSLKSLKIITRLMKEQDIRISYQLIFLDNCDLEYRLHPRLEAQTKRKIECVQKINILAWTMSLWQDVFSPGLGRTSAWPSFFCVLYNYRVQRRKKSGWIWCEVEFKNSETIRVRASVN